MSELKSF
jgi:hypothetical protein